MSAPEGSSDKSKLTNPLVTRFEFLPALISTPLFPPPLLERKPSKDAVADIVFCLAMGVGVGVCVDVEVTLLVGVMVPEMVAVGVMLGLSNTLGVGVRVTSVDNSS